MVLRMLDVLRPRHGYDIAKRIEQVSADMLAVNHGTLCPVLLKLDQEGSIASKWGVSENNRRAKFYRITKAGRAELEKERRHWERTGEIIARFFALNGVSS
jgi:PadR family transcriptional regulator, regulatory protein PadR